MGLEFQSKVLAVMPAVAGSGKTNNIVAIQKAVIAKTNTRVLEHANLTDLLVEEGRCFGGLGVNDSGEPFVIRAGAVVLATGGVGQLFKYSFNPRGTPATAMRWRSAPAPSSSTWSSCSRASPRPGPARRW